MFDAVENAKRLTPYVTAAIAGIESVQAGHQYRLLSDFEGPVMLKLRYRIAPRWKVGIQLYVDSRRDGHTVASAVAALMELPIQYQMWSADCPSDGTYSVAGRWANQPVVTYRSIPTGGAA